MSKLSHRTMCLARMAQALDVSNAAAIQLNQRLGALDIAETLPEAMAEILEGLRPEEAFMAGMAIAFIMEDLPHR